jgi:L-lactate dehydrogenase complex protein LldG
MSERDDSARAAILAGVRRSLGRGALDEMATAALDARLRAPKANVVPARAQIPHAEQVDLFAEMVEEVHGTVARVPSARDVPGAVADYLAQHNLPTDIAMAPDASLDAYPWETRPMLAIRRGRAEEADAVSVTGAVMGFAETGTLMLASGPDHPSTLNFLPETHIVVLRADQITGSYEEGWRHLRERAKAQGQGESFMPRTVNLVTGPSRTADIEQRMQLGAHGPRRLHIVIVED